MDSRNSAKWSVKLKSMYDEHKRVILPDTFLAATMFLFTVRRLCETEADFSRRIDMCFPDKEEFSKVAAELMVDQLRLDSQGSEYNRLAHPIFRALHEAVSALKAVDSVPNLLREIKEIILSEIYLEDPDFAGRIQQWFAMFFPDMNRDPGFRFSLEASELLAKLAQHYIEKANETTLLDPWSGSGDLLLHLQSHFNQKRVTLFGNESNIIRWSLLVMRMYLTTQHEIRIENYEMGLHENPETARRLPPNIADLVVTIVPDDATFSVRERNDVHLNELFLSYSQRVIESLTPEGHALLVVPGRMLNPRPAFFRNERNLHGWRKLIYSGHIEYVIALPRLDVYGQTGHLLVLKKQECPVEERVHLKVPFVQFLPIALRGQPFHDISPFVSAIQSIVASNGESVDSNVCVMEWVDQVGMEERRFSLLPELYARPRTEAEVETQHGKYFVKQSLVDADEQHQFDLQMLAYVDRGLNALELSEKGKYTIDDPPYLDGIIAEDTTARYDLNMSLLSFAMESDIYVYTKSPYRLLNLSHVQQGEIMFDQLSELTVDFNKLRLGKDDFEQRYALENGDLLISGRGTNVKVAVFDTDKLASVNVPWNKKEKILYSNSFIRVRLKKPVPLLIRFLKFYLESPIGMLYLKQMQEKSLQPVISYKELRKLNIPDISLNEINRMFADLEKIEEDLQHIQRLYENKLLEKYRRLATGFDISKF